MKKFFATLAVVAIASFVFFGCSTKVVTIDGKLDQLEAGLVRVGAGGILTANPRYVVPVADITGDLIANFAFVSPEALDTAVKSKIENYGFTAEELASAFELYDFFKLAIGKEVSFPDIPVADRMQVLYDILVEINTSAESRK